MCGFGQKMKLPGANRGAESCCSRLAACPGEGVLKPAVPAGEGGLPPMHQACRNCPIAAQGRALGIASGGIAFPVVQTRDSLGQGSFE